MGQPKSNIEFFEYFRNQTLPDAYCGTLRYKGLRGYSYAQPVIEIYPDFKLRLITSNIFSVTTSRHVRSYHNSPPSFDTTLYVPEITWLDNWANFNYLLNTAERRLGDALQPGIRDTTRMNYLDLVEYALKGFFILAERTGNATASALENYDKLTHIIGTDRCLARVRAVAALTDFKEYERYRGT